MADSTRPIRITKKRANALLEILSKGVEAERSSIEEAFGVKFEVDGTLVVSDDDFDLLDSGQKDEFISRLDKLSDANEASEIFYRRYAAAKKR